MVGLLMVGVPQDVPVGQVLLTVVVQVVVAPAGVIVQAKLSPDPTVAPYIKGRAQVPAGLFGLIVQEGAAMVVVEVPVQVSDPGLKVKLTVQAAAAAVGVKSTRALKSLVLVSAVT
jgi:hypothetical protein